MTAVAGFWSFDGRPVLEPVRRILKAQSAYGSLSACIHDEILGLGRNLYQVLPEDRFDHGPISRGQHKLVADVRLDNRCELGRLVDMSDTRLSTISDAALLFECLLKLGYAATNHLVGEFAFAWWDEKKRRLALGRDILGHRPLYFHRGRGFFAFSTMPSGLHALSEVPYAFDPEFMAESLALFPRLDRRTHFLGIERVRPGHLLLVDAHTEQERRYWNPAPATTRRRDPREYGDELRHLVDTAVGAQLRGANDTVATHLSCGLDSSIVTSSAALQFTGNRILAYTAAPASDFDGPVPSGAIGDERDGAAAAARLYPNVDHVVVESSQASPLEALEREHFYHQQPVANLENAVWGRAMIRDAHARGINVLLTGVVGNLTATYAGMEHLAWLVGRGRVIKAVITSKSLAANGVPWRTLAAHLLGPFLPHRAWSAAAKLRGWVTDLRDYTAVSPSAVQNLKERARQLAFDLTYRPSQDPFRSRLAAYASCDGGNYFKGVLAEWGVSVREPLADRRIIDFCLSVPSEEFLLDGFPRSLARRAFAERLPDASVKSLKRGYQSADWYVALARDHAVLQQEIEAIRRCAPAEAAMDLNWLQQTASSWPSSGWADEKVVMRYRYGLLRAVSAGHFMRKVAGTN